MKKLVEKYCELPRFIRKPMWKFWHNLLIKFDSEAKEVFLNYGYANLNGDPVLKLETHDEPYRYFIQLYHQVTKNHNFENTDILEVGSGRGGGASYLSRYNKPNSYTALDINNKTIEFCKKHHKVNGLNFVEGEAENISFSDENFDAVINIESARCYGSLDKFFSEVHRVLKPKGKFLFADMIKKDEVAGMDHKLSKAGFNTISKTNIRENVVEALKMNSVRNKEEINKKIPRFMRNPFYEFAGVEGTERFNEFYKGKMEYWCYTLEK
jgi:ubiquinone/menaquinone biosynthesis C-methylase UbiE